MSKLHVKESGTWKWVRQAYVKHAGTWKPAIFWVKTGGVWKVSNAKSRVAANSILLFKGTVIPTGFTRYTAADNRFIIGAGGAHAGGDNIGSPTKNYSRNTTTRSSHSGGTSFSTAYDTFGTGTSYYNNASAGGHNHSYDVDIDIRDVFQDYILIKADYDHPTIPEDALVLSASMLSGLMNLETTVDRFVRSAASYGGQGGSATPSNSTTSSNNGAHRHYNNTSNTSNTYNFGSYPRNSSAGGHPHTVTLTLTLNTKQKYLSAWGPGSAAKGFMEGNAIIMSESATPPEGYYLCDGTNGTPDMRDFHLRIGTTANHGNGQGDNVADVDVSTTTDGLHQHRGSDIPNSGGTTGYHSNNRENHSHPESFTDTIDQYAHALYFHMMAA